MRNLISLCFALCLFLTALPSLAASPIIKGDKEWLRKKLTRMGFSQAFISESLKFYEPKSFSSTVTLNLLGFLRPPGEHMDRATAQAVREAGNFIQDNRDTFTVAESRYQVPATVVSSLLWIETRHGRDTGTFHTVSVYLHLVQADRKENRGPLTKMALQKNKELKMFTPKRIREIMKDRTKRKAAWAEEQLVALASIRKKQHLDLKTLRGSYAGAFGLPQFIPSSYRDFAKSITPQGTPNLLQNQDAILSVANYLAVSGWNNDSEDSKVAALMKYNNSRDYADSILEIAKQVPASVTAGLMNRGSATESRSISSSGASATGAGFGGAKTPQPPAKAEAQDTGSEPRKLSATPTPVPALKSTPIPVSPTATPK